MKINDLNFYPDAAIPATPPVGGSFADPTFGTQITRVTDRKLGIGFTPQYSAIYDLSNCDDTRITFLGLDGFHWIADVDTVKRTVQNIRRLAHTGATYWSRVYPDVLYVVETWNQATLWRYHCAADNWDIIADLSRFEKVAAANTAWVDSRGMSWGDDDRFHFSSQNSQSVFVYSQSADKLVGLVKFADALKTVPGLTLYSFAKSQMDAAGRLVLTASEELLINIETGVVFAPNFGDRSGGNVYGDVHPDFAPGLFCCGGMGGIDSTGFWPGVIPIDPADLTTFLTKRQRIGPRVLFGVDTHTSARQADGKWITLTHDGAPQADSGDAKITPVFGNNEIYQLLATGPPDGSRNRRIVQHLSFPNSIPDTGQRYWSAARGCVSQRGKFVGYNSLYGNGAPDLYLAWIDEEPETFTVDELRGMRLQDFARLIA